MSILGDSYRLTESVVLRNRFVASAHGSGTVTQGLPSLGDAEYWQRLAAGGAAMVVVGGSAVTPESTIRRGNLTETWRSEAIPGLARRAEAIRGEGAVAVMQLVHLGRETLGAETFYSPVAPAPTRSPREPTAPRPANDADIARIADGFAVSARHAAEAGFDGIELHAAHGYLLGQFLSPTVNTRARMTAQRAEPVWRIVDAIRDVAPETLIGIRLSVGDAGDAGLELADLENLFGVLHPEIGYVNLAVGMRNTYVKDMATERPPLLGDLARIRAMTTLPLIASQSFRDPDDMAQALTSGADLVGLVRALIADPDLPRKVLAGDARSVRPCVACNEDCRSFDPSLLCTVNPDLAPPGHRSRPAAPLHIGSSAPSTVRRVAVVGAGPAGLECALHLARNDRDVTLWERTAQVGGGLLLAGAAPHRGGWLRMVDYYRFGLDSGGVKLRLAEEPGQDELAGFDAIMVAAGAEEIPPAIESEGFVRTASQAIASGVDGLRGAGHVVVVDDGFGWWPSVSAVELAVSAAAQEVTLVTPGASFAAGIPAESRAQLLPRLRTMRFCMRPLSELADTEPGAVRVRDLLTGRIDEIAADAVVVVGERRSRDLSALLPPDARVVVIGDALVPRKFAHAIAEGREAARSILVNELAGVR